jgi:hypothetical protein
MGEGHEAHRHVIAPAASFVPTRGRWLFMLAARTAQDFDDFYAMREVVVEETNDLPVASSSVSSGQS